MATGVYHHGSSPTEEERELADRIFTTFPNVCWLSAKYGEDTQPIRDGEPIRQVFVCAATPEGQEDYQRLQADYERVAQGDGPEVDVRPLTGDEGPDELPEDIPRRDALIEAGYTALEDVQAALVGGTEELEENVDGVGEATATDIQLFIQDHVT